MSIDSVLKVPDWKKIVSTFKQGPCFGIHGATFENAKSIENSRSDWIMAHYFSVGVEEKRLPDGEFYEKLWASIVAAEGHSTKLNVTDREINFRGLPALILGIEGKRTLVRGAAIEANTGPFMSYYGNKHETLPIGHDFHKYCGVEIKMVYLDENTLASINEKMSNFSRRLGEKARGKEILCSYFAIRELTRNLLRKVYHTVQPYYFSMLNT